MTRNVFFVFLAVLACAIAVALYFFDVPYTLFGLKSAPGVSEITLPEVSPMPKVKIMLVPGHDLVDVGTTYKGVTEEKLSRELAGKLAELLATDGRFEVTVTRDPATGEYAKEFSDYFESNKEAIEAFKSGLKQEMRQKLRTGEVERDVTIVHNNTTTRAGNILYGMNMWANEHDVDLMLHIHFNNYPRAKITSPGKYSGYALYVPEHQYDNATSSKKIATSIEARLHEFTHPSTLPIESDTIIESQDLIAVGANNSRTGPSILIEYGYIYEPGMADGSYVKAMAEKSYAGIIDYYFPKVEVKGITDHAPFAKPILQSAAIIDYLKNSIPKRVKVNVSAAAYVAADLDTGEILLQKNRDQVLPIASVSKLITALVATKYMDSNKMITIDRTTLETEGTFGELYPGEKLKVGTLLYPLLMESSNDAGEALAESYGREAFIALMNKEARQIGATHTHFEDPTGLSEKNVSTPEDLVRIATFIKKNYPLIFNITELKTYTTKGHIWKNPTHFLGMKTYQGGKNGYTYEAQYTAVSLFNLKSKTKSANIAVALLKSKNRDKDILSIIQSLDLERGVVQ